MSMGNRVARYGLWAAVGMVLLWPWGAAAQGSGGVARSGMGQGEAQISTRSDVQLGIESGAGTSGQRLQDMVRAISSKLGEIRQCYGRITAEDPSVVGHIDVDVSLPRRGRVQLETRRNTVENRTLTRCVTRALQRANYGAVRRPANVKVKLSFGNTAAAGAEEVARRREEGAQVTLTRDAEGNLVAQGGVPSGEVRFQLSAPESVGAEALAAMQRAVRSEVAGLLDCRRRAGRRGMDPEGEIEFRLVVQRRGRARARKVDSSVQDSRAPICVSRVISRTRFSSEAAGRATLTVRFAPRRELDVPTRD